LPRGPFESTLIQAGACVTRKGAPMKAEPIKIETETTQKVIINGKWIFTEPVVRKEKVR
jgi:hypothetical protein